MSKSTSRLEAYNKKITEKPEATGEVSPNYKWDFKIDNIDAWNLDFRNIGKHRLTRPTKGTAQMLINSPDFKHRVEPEGNMIIRRFPRQGFMEYNFTYSTDEQYLYIVSVFEAFCLLVG